MSELKLSEMTGEDFADMTDRIRYCYGRYGMDDVADVFDRLQSDLAAARARIAELVTLLDQQLGTPCEAIRHQQEVEALNERIAALTTVTEDDVEAAARAICLENIRANGDGTAVDPFGWGEYLTDARAALAALMARKVGDV